MPVNARDDKEQCSRGIHLDRLSNTYGRSRASGLHFDTSFASSVSNGLRTTKSICLESTRGLRKFHPIWLLLLMGFLLTMMSLTWTALQRDFSSIPEAIEDVRQGKFVIVVDDEDRENEGDLIMAASKVTPEAMAFIVRHGTGIVCVSMKEEDLERKRIFTDAKEGTTTGVSAKDRANTILALASADSKPEDFNRPGHIFPLKYREGGVLKRAGHTEASVDLAMLAGLPPVAVLCEIVDDNDGSMALLPKLQEFAKKENLKIISIADLIRVMLGMVKIS
ncbi:hypothetical protein PR202_gb02859 [Eleusine coracana subsp. coracana]|uniref:3,4-dihydroxy-2-butanone 4-phosphate synthase n=1 Tax=Eleusine coracana subsp. coracana TaxID=191504 RepID=A0AAV5E0D5_ELECO|nr:hypothetical protein PR202_gb02859 [Eleusine coracana subsp. coracana]